MGGGLHVAESSARSENVLMTIVTINQLPRRKLMLKITKPFLIVFSCWIFSSGIGCRDQGHALTGSESSPVVRDSDDRFWQSFVYPNGIENAASSEAILSAAGPVFTSEEECVSWSAQEVAKYPSAGYQCGYNCTYRKGFGTIICEGLARTRPRP